MLKGLNPNLYDLAEQQFVSGLNLAQQVHYNDAIDEAIYGSDEFRMYAYKIKRCTRMRSHDWTECPYAHRGEKAQRRDPRKVPYTGIACPAFRNGRCRKGDGCEYAHGIFEYWLHPERYRTRACNAGRFCTRKVCFFAHTPSQLRSETKHNCTCHFTYKLVNNADHHQVMVMAGGGSTGDHDQGSMLLQDHHHHDQVQADHVVVHAQQPIISSSNNNNNNLSSVMNREGVSELMRRLRALRIREDEEREIRNNTITITAGDPDLAQLGWISELLK